MIRVVRAAALCALLAALCALTALGAGCKAIGFAPNEPDPEAVRRPPERVEPERVTVQHVLLGFDGAETPGATRTREEAERLTQRVLEMARGGRSFDELVRLYSDDRHGDGSYVLVNYGVSPEPTENERRKMVRGFGDLAFALEPGEVALVEYDRYTSPLGFHVLRRLR